MQSIMLIGAMKCGTTTLFNHLIQHPEICGCLNKEPEYFSVNFGNAKYKEGRYETLFNYNEDRHKFILDGSTGYAKYPQENGVPDRMKAYGLNPYFLYVVRNPIERIVSHFNFMKGDINWKKTLNSPELVHTSRYFTQLEEYARVFSKERILVLDFDELKQDPAGLCRRVFDFVGAGEFDVPVTANMVKNKTKPENKTEKLIESRLMGWGRYFPGFFKNWVRVSLKNVFPAKQTKLTKTQEWRLRTLLKEDMENLKDIYGIDVQKWGY